VKKGFLASLPLFFLLISIAASGTPAREQNGAELFKKHCSSCHHSAARFKPDADIILAIRNPPPSMPAFDSLKIPDSAARAIASFIQLQVATKYLCNAW
jgi:mono/diheme cytochrome c family protein